MERRTFLVGSAVAAAAAIAPRAGEAQTLALPLGNLPADTHYPPPGVEVVNKRFGKYVIGSAPIERIATGFWTADGPVYFGDGGYLLWSDHPNDRIMRWLEDDGHVSVYRQPSNNANGNTRDREGRLLTCEIDSRRVTRTEHNGSITVIMDKVEGKLNVPNDVVVASDGGIWFSYPDGGKRAPVYRVDGKTGKAKIVTDELLHPNGLAFSPDEKKLYIVCTSKDNKSNIVVYDVQGEGISNPKIFVGDFGGQPVDNGDPNHAPGRGTDGIRVDTDGNVWCSINSGGAMPEPGVWCYGPDGVLLGKIHLPEPSNHLCFGGKKRNRLFMCGHSSMYSLYVEATGAMVP